MDLKQRIRDAKIQRVAEETGIPFETLRRFVSTDQERIKNATHWVALLDWAGPRPPRTADYWRGYLDAARQHADVTARLMANVSAAGELGATLGASDASIPESGARGPAERPRATRRRRVSE